MPKAEINVHARNTLGQFIREVEAAGTMTVKELIEIGAEESRRQAPVGVKHDLRTIPLKDSIMTMMTGRSRGKWFSVARHALYVEKGTKPHEIPGNPFLRFFWENEGRMWIPGLFGTPDVVHHPGAKAQPFLEPALKKVMHVWREVAKRRYPG